MGEITAVCPTCKEPITYTVISQPDAGGKLNFNVDKQNPGNFSYLPYATTLATTGALENFKVLVTSPTKFITTVEGIPLVGIVVTPVVQLLYRAPIVSDLLAGLSGGMGMAAGGNIGDGLSMFEPVHGSAPDIAGTGRANPLAAILSGELLLRHLGEHEAADAVGGAVTAYLEESDPEGLPFELGGTSPVERSGDEVASHIAG